MYADKNIQKEAMKEASKRYEEKRAGTRSRNWSFIVYPDDLPENWTELIDDTHIRWIEGPQHDRDAWTVEDEEKNPEHKAGEVKKIHKHCLAMFENNINQKRVVDFFKGLFGESETGSINGVLTPIMTADRSGTVRYMAHLDSPSKAQYDVSEIVGHNGADPQEIIKFSMSETLHKMIEMEKFIEQYDVTSLCDFAPMIREEHIDWYQILTTKNTYYFNCFIHSRYEKKKAAQDLQKAIDEGTAFIDENGVIRYKKRGDNK